MEVPKCLSGNEHVSQLRVIPTVRFTVSAIIDLLLST
uniref:Uncharacterized protein n=1 Tax=Brassica campestris TaxID=3711 RepID=A0A3P6BUN6_BRACM|nr:unnamed protein product [Brassica rapa]